MSVTSPIPTARRQPGQPPAAAAVAEKPVRPAAARPEPPKPGKPYPFVAVGMMVNWYEQGLVNTPPQPATVTAIGDLSIEVAVHRADSLPQEKVGVRYAHERNVPDLVREESGGWDYTSWDHRLIARDPKLRQWPGEDKPEEPAEPAATTD